MRLQIFSDLHVGVAPIKPITIAADVDAVIVAGDTCEGIEKAFRTLRSIVPEHIPVIMVAGNHEFYHGFVPDELAAGRALARSYNVCFLENDVAIMKGVRFVGCTLWTDYRIFGEKNVPAIMNACASGMNDHRLIGWQKRPWLRFRPQEAALLHYRSRAFLSDTLADRFDGPTVTITHHAVHWKSIQQRYVSDPVTAAYLASDTMETLLVGAQPALIVHGHVHHSVDYRIGATRVLCNPHGYGTENPAFDGSLVVEV
jgi:Icc-related predicted phosphoesterase